MKSYLKYPTGDLKQLYVYCVDSIARAFLHVEFKLFHEVGIGHIAKTGCWQLEASDCSLSVSFLGMDVLACWKLFNQGKI